MNYLQAALIAIVEGLTEFLPVSSTGHMIITTSIMGIASHDFTKLFTIAIQLGAILSVVYLYRQRFIDGLKDLNFYFKIGLAFIPAAIFGKLLDDYIDALLENVVTVAISLLVGGIVLLFIDKLFTNNNKTETTYKNALVIGLFQLIAMIPGVSRSAATIIGGLSQQLTKEKAAEFSFFLAVPTMLAATGYKLYKYLKLHAITSNEIGILAFGNIIAFIVALVAIKSFIGYVSNNGFKVFGWYRIIVGAIILVLYFMNIPLTIV
jgi:undecaprenyl-diphosphatase